MERSKPRSTCLMRRHLLGGQDTSTVETPQSTMGSADWKANERYSVRSGISLVQRRLDPASKSVLLILLGGYVRLQQTAIIVLTFLPSEHPLHHRQIITRSSYQDSPRAACQFHHDCTQSRHPFHAYCARRSISTDQEWRSLL